MISAEYVVLSHLCKAKLSKVKDHLSYHSLSNRFTYYLIDVFLP